MKGLELTVIARALRARRMVRVRTELHVWRDVAATRSAALKYCRANPDGYYDISRLGRECLGLWGFATALEREAWEKHSCISINFKDICHEIDILTYKSEVLSLLVEHYNL